MPRFMPKLYGARGGPWRAPCRLLAEAERVALGPVPGYTVTHPMARITIPFSSGAREDVDPRVMPEGALKRVENLRLTREGRLALRYGYSSVALTTQKSFASAINNLLPHDLVNYNGRLFAVGAVPLTFDGPADFYEYVDEPRYKWRSTSNDLEPRLCPVTKLRNLSNVAAFTQAVSRMDVAAGGGRVCFAYQSSSTVVTVWIVDAVTNSLLLEQSITSLTAPRVVAVGSVFFLLGITSAGTAVQLRRFDPSTDDYTFTALTDAFAAGATVSLMDAQVNEAGTGFSVAIARNATPAVTIKVFSSAGAATNTITSLAAVLIQLAVYQQATRVHIVTVEADFHVDLRTYVIATGALENTSTDLASTALTDRQPTLIADLSTNLAIAFYEKAALDVIKVTLAPATHAGAVVLTGNRHQLNTKLAVGSEFSGLVDGVFYGCLVAENASTSSHCLLMDYSLSIVGAFIDKGLAAAGHAEALPNLPKDASTGKFYWARLVNDNDARAIPAITEFEVGSHDRRQMCVVDGQLYIAGGVVQSFAGRQVSDAGFLNRPHIISATPSNVAGSLTPLAQYAIACTYEWLDEQNRLHQSEPSDVTEVTMGAADDTITLSVSGPITSRLRGTEATTSVKLVAYQSLAAPDKQLLRAANANTNNNQALLEIACTLTKSDTDLSDEGAIYTQASSGARSGPNPFLAPFPATTLWASASKIQSAGLPNEFEIQESRAPFPGEPISWAENLGGRATAFERVLAIVSLDERRIGFTANGLCEWTGEGLDINGSGDLGTPRRIPSPGGLYGGADGWRSLCETAIGIFFQLASDSIYLLPRGGGTPVFIGKEVMDTLAAFPTITSATYVKNDQLVCFTCNNLAANDAVILVYDLNMQQWFVDTETSALTSSCEYQGRLIILRAANTIEFQDTSYPASVFITPVIETGTLYPFGKGGQGQIDEIQLFAEFRGACNVICSLSFDDGANYTALTTKALTGLTVGSAVTLKWGPNVMRGDRVRLKFTTTDLSGATEQLAFHFATIDFTGSDRSALRNSTQKG